MKIIMRLLSDTIFGNGESVPGGEDISVLTDAQGFPYFKGGTLKGIFREELIRNLGWKGLSTSQVEAQVGDLLGESGDNRPDEGKLRFSDLVVSQAVKQAVLKEIGDNPEVILASFSDLRTFTSIEENGMAKAGSLRMARCIHAGISFEGEVLCTEDQRALVREVVALIKYVGTMRNRGFGRVLIEEKEAVR